MTSSVRAPSQWGAKQRLSSVLAEHSLPYLAQWALRRGFRRLTARARILPDFIILGAQRCGTTSLYNYLAEHGEVFPAFIKETHFFDWRFSKGLSWYRAYFPMSLHRAYVQRVRRRAFVTGESTPYYLFYPHAPRRVWETIPNARLIVMLRNPVDRAYSHYHHEVRTGAETASFEAALAREADILPAETVRIVEDGTYRSFAHVHHAYLSRGIYVDQLRRWTEFFDRQQMLILKSEDFYCDPPAVLEVVADFLGLSTWASDPRAESARPIYNLAHYNHMDSATRERLAAYFEPHNRRLYKVLGTDLGWENERSL